MNKKNNKGLIIFIVLILIILFICSSILNLDVMKKDNNIKNKYNTVNKFNDSFATIPSSKRKKLFKDIGFDVSRKETRKKDDGIYITTYAYHKAYKDLYDADTLSVYYDDKNTVNYVSLNLIYPENNLDVNTIKIDCNNILQNFVKVNISNDLIDIVKKKNSYYVIQNDINIYFKLNKESKYYLFNVIIKK